MSKETDYKRIAQAIEFIQQHFKQQPSLEEIAKAVNLSTYHFQRLFTEWAGTSPKQFSQYLSIDYARSLIKEKELNLFDTAYETGLSSTGRLHDLFVKIESMTPDTYKKGGQGIEIQYQFYPSPFGKVLIASTDKGVCYMAFTDNEEVEKVNLKKQFPKANFYRQNTDFHQAALSIFTSDKNISLPKIKLHLKGTPFQLKVWEALLKIPSGNLSTYGKIAQEIDKPKASRAVGTAIGSNPIAYLIPCHRVIQNSGKTGGYRWGSTRKSAINVWEAAQTNE